MKQVQNRSIYVALAMTMLVYIVVYILQTTSYPQFPNNPDIANYATSLLQGEHPELYTRDPVFADGSLTQVIWASGSLYMRLFQGLLTITGNNISQTLGFLHLIPSVLSVLTFYWFLRIFKLDAWVTLMTATALSVWILLTRYDGIPSLYYFACIPVFLRLLWEHIIEPSLTNKPVMLWRAVLIGFFIGVSPALINSVNGLAFNLFTVVALGLQWILGRMKWRSFVAVLLGLVPILLFVSLGGTGGARVVLTDMAARNLIPTIPLPVGPWGFYFLMLVCVTLCGLRLRSRPTKFWKILFLLASCTFWVFPLGNVTLAFLLYFLSRILRHTDDELDYVLIVALSICIFIGPILLWIFMFIWSITHIHLLIFIMWQMFRFHLIGYFIGGVVILRSVTYFVKPISDPWIQRVTQPGLLILFAVQASYFRFEYPMIVLSLILITFFLASQRPSLIQWRVLSSSMKVIGSGVLVVGVTGATYVLTRNGAFSGVAIFVLLITASVYIILLLVSLSNRPLGRLVSGILILTMLFITTTVIRGEWFGLYDAAGKPFVSLTDEEYQDYLAGFKKEQQQKADFLDMTNWLRTQTPVDSLVHLHQTYDTTWSFRYLSERSQLFSWMDEVMGQYNPPTVERNHQIVLDVHETKPEFILSIIAQYDVDYVVFPVSEPVIYPAWNQGNIVLPVQVYHNSSYTVYQIKTIPAFFAGLELFSEIVGKTGQ